MSDNSNPICEIHKTPKSPGFGYGPDGCDLIYICRKCGFDSPASDEAAEIGSQFTEHRRDFNLTLGEAADMLNIKSSSLSQIERGVAGFTQDELNRLVTELEDAVFKKDQP